MGVKRLRSIFMRYILIVAVGVLCIIFANIWIYMTAIKTDVIYSTVEVEKIVNEVKEELQASSGFSSNAIPSFVEYAWFDLNGNLKQSSLKSSDAELLWESCIVNQKESERPYRFSLVKQENDIIILRYRFTAQFSNPIFRKIIPVADLFAVIVSLIEVIVLLFIISYFFGKYTGKKIEKLLTVTQKIKEQDLDFIIDSSGIFEIDQALNALDDMKIALKNSLAEQWNANKVQQEQISALAHDLKTPLTIIRGNTDLLYDTVLNDEQKECADFIQNSSIQMQKYIQTLIEVTKTSKALILQQQSVNTADFMIELKKRAKGLCSAKGIFIDYTEHYETTQINIDKTQLLRAYENVLSNAVEHTPEKETIFLRIAEEHKYLKIIVRDMGTGFSSEALKRATEQFYMDDGSRNSKSHYGIGLYIADTIVKHHNGQLILSNDDITGGAVVTIAIPV